MPGPLEGIRVVDLSRLAPGPYASMLLGDLGADVTLVEAPAGAVQVIGGRETDEAAADRRRAFGALGRNKRSIVVNLKSDEGRQVVHDLAREADVFLEGFRPGVTDRLGVGYEAIRATNPRIVYASLSGFGQTGPYRDLVGHDINYIAVGGALGMIGRDGRPALPQNVIADFAGGGLMTAFAIVSALLARGRTGAGQYLDMAMSDNVLYLLASATGGVLAGGAPPSPGRGNLGGGSPHYNVYECADGKWISIGSLEPQFWANLCRVTGREDMLDGEFDASRHAEFAEHLARFFRGKSRDAWFADLRAVELCIAPVLDLREALDDEHQRARGMVVDVPDARVGSVPQVGIGPKFSETPGAVHSTAPRAGEHTDEVLAALGYDQARVTSLREQGVVG
ncbi:MAG: CaiB/BaiF CoA-transferase family protein [Chloroflexi bacterium]|nr:CaiB/BaiF CoA-transferase family protein [Chloroflexota bacterium]MDA1241272.1 CaiB/BaiF CoA-transferase family protein [Chloroflexota bacterium]